MKKIIFIFFLFSTAFGQIISYDINLNGCIVEVEENGYVRYSFDAGRVTYREVANDDIEIRDDIYQHTFDIDYINNFSSVPTLVDSLNAWHSLCGGSIDFGSLFSNIDTTQVDTSVALSRYFSTQNDTLSAILITLENADYGSDSTYIQDFEQTYRDSTSEIISLLGDLLNISYDTTQVDTSLINYLSQWERQNDTLSEILNALNSQSDTVQSNILNDSLKVWFSQPIEIIDNDFDSVYVVNRDTSVVEVVGMSDTLYTYDLDTSIVYSIDSTYTSQLDSLIQLLNNDTVVNKFNYAYYEYCYIQDSTGDNYTYYAITDMNNVPSSPVFISFVDVKTNNAIYIQNNGVDLLGTPPDYENEYTSCEKWQSLQLINVLMTIDTCNGLLPYTPVYVYGNSDTSIYSTSPTIKEHMPSTLVDTTGCSYIPYYPAPLKDTLKYAFYQNYNGLFDNQTDTFQCKDLTLQWGLTDTSGTSSSGYVLVTNVRTGFTSKYIRQAGVLPILNNTEPHIVDGTNAIGFYINATGCEEGGTICITTLNVVDCDTNNPIGLCSGWASSSGIWSTISGCWNTGQ